MHSSKYILANRIVWIWYAYIHRILCAFSVIQALKHNLRTYSKWFFFSFWNQIYGKAISIRSHIQTMKKKQKKGTTRTLRCQWGDGWSASEWQSSMCERENSRVWHHSITVWHFLLLLLVYFIKHFFLVRLKSSNTTKILNQNRDRYTFTRSAKRLWKGDIIFVLFFSFDFCRSFFLFEVVVVVVVAILKNGIVNLTDLFCASRRSMRNKYSFWFYTE